jgi:hypothetical protein
MESPQIVKRHPLEVKLFHGFSDLLIRRVILISYIKPQSLQFLSTAPAQELGV